MPRSALVLCPGCGKGNAVQKWSEVASEVGGFKFPEKPLNPEDQRSGATDLFLTAVTGTLWATQVALPRAERQAAMHKIRMDLWEQAKERWWQLHYCARCNALFIPGQDHPVPVSKGDSLLYGMDSSE